MRRLTGSAALSLALAGACTGSNIIAPRDTGEGVVVFASDREGGIFQLYAIGGPGGNTPRRLPTDLQWNELSPVLSRDGRRIAWQREISDVIGSIREVEIWVANADGSEARQLVGNGSFNESPEWTANDEAIVYASRIEGSWDIFIAPLDGDEPRNLTGTPYADQHPRVSPDGSRIVFHSNRDVNFEIYVMDADGSNPRNVSADPAEDRFPTWTPDGRIVWSRFNTSFDLHIMNGDGSGQRPLLLSPFQDTHASVSPDGAKVVFQSDRFAPWSLLVMPLSGGTPEALTGRDPGITASDLTPSWGRAPR